MTYIIKMRHRGARLMDIFNGRDLKNRQHGGVIILFTIRDCHDHDFRPQHRL